MPSATASGIHSPLYWRTAASMVSEYLHNPDSRMIPRASSGRLATLFVRAEYEIANCNWESSTEVPSDLCAPALNTVVKVLAVVSRKSKSPDDFVLRRTREFKNALLQLSRDYPLGVERRKKLNRFLTELVRQGDAQAYDRAVGPRPR